MASWDEEKEACLASMWEDRPFLYDHTALGFANKAKKDQAFREIAYAVDIQVGDVIKRMTSMRTQYSRAKNKGIHVGKSPSKKMRWMIDHLNFLAPFIETRNGAPDNPKDDAFDDVDGVGDQDPAYEAAAVIPPRIQFKKRDYKAKPKSKKRKLEIDDDILDEELSDEEFDLYQEENHAKNSERSERSTECSSPHLTTKVAETPMQQRDQEQLFCEFIAGELRQIKDPIAKAKLMNTIQNEVFSAKIGELSRTHSEGYSAGEGNSDQSGSCQINSNILSPNTPSFKFM